MRALSVERLVSARDGEPSMVASLLPGSEKVVSSGFYYKGIITCKKQVVDDVAICCKQQHHAYLIAQARVSLNCSGTRDRQAEAAFGPRPALSSYG